MVLTPYCFVSVGSETEKSPSVKKDKTPNHSPTPNRRHSPKHPRPHELLRQKSKTRQIVIQDLDTSQSDRSLKHDDHYNRNDTQLDYDSSDVDVVNPSRSRKKFSRAKSSSASRLNNNLKSKEPHTRACSPVENLRKQLQKVSSHTLKPHILYTLYIYLQQLEGYFVSKPHWGLRSSDKIRK